MSAALWQVPKGAKLLVIGSAPEKTEFDQGRPFSSNTRKMVRTAIKQFGLDPDNEVGYAYITTDQLQFEKGKPQRPSNASVAACQLLVHALHKFEGRAILCVGVEAFERVMGAEYRQLLHRSRSQWEGYIHPVEDVPTRVLIGKESFLDADDPIKSGPNKGNPRRKKRDVYLETPVGEGLAGIGACQDPHTVRLQGFSTKAGFLAAIEKACAVAQGAVALTPHDLAQYDDLYRERPTDWDLAERNLGVVDLAFDIENTPEGITYISFAEVMTDGSIGQHGSFTWTPATKALAVRLLGSESPYQNLVAHNAAYDAGQLLAFEDVVVRGSSLAARGEGLVDTMMAAHLHQPDLPKGLGAMWRYMPPMNPTKHLAKESMRFYNLIDSTLCGRVWATLRVFLQRMGQRSLLQDECASIMVLDRMSRNGLPLDVARLDQWIEESEKKITELTGKWWAVSGLTQQSGASVLKWVFEDHGAPVLGTTATGQPQLTAEIMEKLIEMHDDELADGLTHLLELKKLSKLVSTYGVGFLEKVDEQGYLHPSYLPDVKDAGDLGTAAGRLSSSPNVQNVPKDMRWIFRAPEGWVIGDSDLSAVEGRVQAVLADDLELLDMYDREGFDMHTYNLENARARLLEAWTEGLKVSSRKKLCKERLAAVEKGVWPIVRKNMKTFLYGWNYGAGDRKIASSLGLSLFEAVAIREAYEASRPATTAWRKAVVAEARSKKYLQNAFGRIRYFYGVVPDTHVRNQAINFFPQSTVADMFWTWFPEVEELLAEYGGHLITQVHDSFVWMLPQEAVVEFVPRLDALMTREWPMIAPGFRVPATHEVGLSWGECETFEAERWVA